MCSSRFISRAVRQRGMTKRQPLGGKLKNVTSNMVTVGIADEISDNVMERIGVLAGITDQKINSNLS